MSLYRSAYKCKQIKFNRCLSVLLKQYYNNVKKNCAVTYNLPNSRFMLDTQLSYVIQYVYHVVKYICIKLKNGLFPLYTQSPVIWMTNKLGHNSELGCKITITESTTVPTLAQNFVDQCLIIHSLSPPGECCPDDCRPYTYGGLRDSSAVKATLKISD